MSETPYTPPEVVTNQSAGKSERIPSVIPIRGNKAYDTGENVIAEVLEEKAEEPLAEVFQPGTVFGKNGLSVEPMDDVKAIKLPINVLTHGGRKTGETTVSSNESLVKDQEPQQPIVESVE
jgi:hypothetical protein